MLAAVAAGELGGMVGLQAQHLRVGVRVAPVPPGHIPESLAHLAADEQRRVQVDLVVVSQLDQEIQLLKAAGL